MVARDKKNKLTWMLKKSTEKKGAFSCKQISISIRKFYHNEILGFMNILASITNQTLGRLCVLQSSEELLLYKTNSHSGKARLNNSIYFLRWPDSNMSSNLSLCFWTCLLIIV